MSNVLMLPSVAVGVFATVRWMDDKVFTNTKWCQNIVSNVLNSSDEEIQNIAVNIIKGAAVGFLVGAIATSVPAAFLVVNPKVCIAFGALAGTVVGVIKATAFLNMSIYLESPHKEFLRRSTEFI